MYSQDIINKAVELYCSGLGIVAVSKKLGMSNNSIPRWVRKAGKRVRPKGWRGGHTPSNFLERRSTKYIDWRIEIFNRDNFACVCCFKTGGYLEAHHILSWKEFPDNRFDIENGATLCKSCHQRLHRLQGNIRIYQRKGA